MIIIEKLAALHFKLEGKSPKTSFWNWLDAHGVAPTEKELKEFYKEVIFAEKNP